METYIEVTFIHNILVCLFAYYASCYMSLSKEYKRFFYVYILIEQAFVCICFQAYLYPLFYLLEIMFTIFVFYLQYKKLFMYICIKYMIFFTCFKLFGGSFHLLHYFVPASRNVMGVWLILVFGILLLKQKWGAFLSVSEYIFPLRIYADKPFSVYGFIDSGNQMEYNGKPVLFLDMSYAHYFSSQNAIAIDVSTIHSVKKMQIYLSEIRVHRYKKQSCYICCDNRVRLEWNCHCLLNFTLWE